MISELSSGALLGPYELLLRLPRTGAAEVWLARLVGAAGFRSLLALKTIPRSYFDDVPTEHLLLEQAALAAGIHHPNLVETLDLGEQDDTLYVAMEWVDGEPLQAVVIDAASRGGVPLPIAVNLVGQLCRGLHAIHEHRAEDGVLLGAVHGHISLQNLLLAYNGTAKLCDFGIANAMDRLSFLTSANQRNHKLTFAAPEQLNSRPVDRRSDVFSAGTLLYLLTTSRHPFEGGDVRATLNNICSSQPALPPGPACPEPLRDVLTKALRKAPDERWASALELGTALENAMPDSFHSSSDQALAAYLDELCWKHKLEFHTQMHAAERRQDKSGVSGSVGPTSGIPNSLHGVAMDAISDAASEQQRPRTGLFVAHRPLVATLLGVFACCLAIGLGFASRVARVDQAPRAVLASRAATPDADVQRILIPRAPPTPNVSAAGAALIPGLPAQPTATFLARAPRPSPPSGLIARGVRLTSGSGVPAASSSAAHGERGATPGKLDAWDTSNFGGRY